MSYSSLNKDQRYQLIELVKERPVLYDKRHRLWRSVKEKDYRWKEIGELCNATGVACKKAWKTLRDQYYRYLRMPKSKRKKYRYLNELSFLGEGKKKSNGKTTHSSTAHFSDFSDYSDDLEETKPTTRAALKKSINKSKSINDDDEEASTSHSSENENEEYIYFKEGVSTEKLAGNNGASELFRTFNTLLNQRFELNEDENDVFLRMLAKKMKCLPNTVINRLQECFLEQVNFETLQCLPK